MQPGMAQGQIKVSLRATDGWDTTRVTQAFGGGGHAAASSCVMAAAEFETWTTG